MRTQIKHIYVTIVISIFISYSYCSAQDPIFSQFYNAPLQINPALAGLTNNATIYINYRNQWTGLPTAFQTSAVTYSKAIENSNSGFAVSLENDLSNRGIYSQTRLGLAYSYDIKIKKDRYIKFGLEPTLGYNTVNYSKLCFSDQIITGVSCDNALPTGESSPESTSKLIYDLGMGILYYSPHFYSGISFKHLNSPTTNFYDSGNNNTTNLPVRLTLLAGYRYEFLDETRDDFSAFLAPNAILVRQGEYMQINAGTLVGYRTFFVGAWLRWTSENQDAVIFNVGSTIGGIKWTYSYDATISNLLLSNTGGSHEIGILLTPAFNKKPKSRHLNCFDIFR